MTLAQLRDIAARVHRGESVSDVDFADFVFGVLELATETQSQINDLGMTVRRFKRELAEAVAETERLRNLGGDVDRAVENAFRRERDEARAALGDLAKHNLELDAENTSLRQAVAHHVAEVERLQRQLDLAHEDIDTLNRRLDRANRDLDEERRAHEMTRFDHEREVARG